MWRRLILVWILVIGALVLVACGGTPTASAPEASAPAAAAEAETGASGAPGVDLAAVKDYALEHGNLMKTGTAALALL